MSKELTKEEQKYIDDHDGYSREDVWEMPSTPLLREIYIEDKYYVKKNPAIEDWDALKQKIRDNGHYCISKKDKILENQCMCKEFKNADCEGPCTCGLYIKELRDDKSFEKMRVTSLKRRDGKPLGFKE